MEKQDKSEINKKLNDIMQYVLGEKYKEASNEIISNKIDVSSLEAIQIIALMEDSFLIEVNGEDLNSDFISTIDKLTDYVYMNKQLKS